MSWHWRKPSQTSCNSVCLTNVIMDMCGVSFRDFLLVRRSEMREISRGIYTVGTGSYDVKVSLLGSVFVLLWTAIWQAH